MNQSDIINIGKNTFLKCWAQKSSGRMIKFYENWKTCKKYKTYKIYCMWPVKIA